MATIHKGKSAKGALPSNMHYFVEGDVKLQSALSFSQYAFPVGSDFRLFTIIGEQHELEFKCEKDSKTTSVAEYALRTLQNPKAQVLLEIDPKFITTPERWPRSIPIKEILAPAVKDKALLGKIRGYTGGIAGWEQIIENSSIMA